MRTKKLSPSTDDKYETHYIYNLITEFLHQFDGIMRHKTFIFLLAVW